MQLKRNYALILWFSVAFAATWTPAVSGNNLQNQLSGSASPYLSMHAKDPTAWQAWSKETVAKAKAQNKLLFVSVGYFSCHWCHVMQRESYQNKEIAHFINKNFIPVKIDRETEPALDAHLISFSDKTQGYSGWPLNVFLTPDGYPLYAAVYLPPKNFSELLHKLQELWSKQSIELSKLAAAEQKGGQGPGQAESQKVFASQLRAAVNTVAVQIGSPLNGGFGDASKFPSTPQLEFLLSSIEQDSDKPLKEFLELTLDNMADYGLRDQLGGGFFRYTVDPGWKTPHFEKMLYDNAQMAIVYMKAAKIFRNKKYDRIAKSTLKFMQDKMLDKRGALIASYSAIDDKNIEGGYYLWDKSEIEKILSKQEWNAYKHYSGMVDPSPLDDGYLPVRPLSIQELSKQINIPAVKLNSLIESAEQKLIKKRDQRLLPRDEKLLAGWNGLALSAFSKGATQYSNTSYKITAEKIRNYIVNRLWDGDRLMRAEDNGKQLGQASLEDYAYVAEGLYRWAILTGKTGDFKLARSVVSQAWQRFYTKQGWRLSEPGFIPMESPVDVLADGPMSSPSGVILRTSMKLSKKLNDASLKQKTMAALNSGQKLISSDPFWYATQISAMAE